MSPGEAAYIDPGLLELAHRLLSSFFSSRPIGNPIPQRPEPRWDGALNNHQLIREAAFRSKGGTTVAPRWTSLRWERSRL